jgi:hypothetical protein
MTLSNNDLDIVILIKYKLVMRTSCGDDGDDVAWNMMKQ